MLRLINAYRKLQAYLRKHQMAACTATPEEIIFLKMHLFDI